ncbi:hypothetical protein [Methylobacter svalbardensis]|uniref:hypothetical protein n=1 Tax=Methylobacter svalbardensis TaxID=3080016 RepID=UPI0030EF3C01
MNKYRKSRDYTAFIGWSDSADLRGKIARVWVTVSRLCCVGILVIAVCSVVFVSTGDWGVRSAMAHPPLPLGLAVTGPQQAKAGEPLSGIHVRLSNPGLAVPDSRLRLFIHDEGDRDLGVDDIKIDVQEGSSWKEVQVEVIDGGVMGAIGEQGKTHKERHQRGGFAVGEKVNKNWPLRVTIRLPGRYSMVVTVSPDNGATHLAQPVSLSMKVL